MGRWLVAVGVFLGLMGVLGCELIRPPAPQPPGAVERLGRGDWPEQFGDDLDAASLGLALSRSRTYLEHLAPDSVFRYGPDTYTAAHLLASLNDFEQAFKTLGPGPELTRVLARDFVLYRATGLDGEGRMLCTGYYEPLLEGALVPGGAYRWPLYRRPPDLIEVRLKDFSSGLPDERLRGRVDGSWLKPYYTRQEIDRRGALTGRNLELAWVDDPIALFFLHVQGSGRVRLPGGETVLVGYDGANGRAYRSLGARMVELGLLAPEEVSLQTIRAWLIGHADQAADLLDYNQSYVFFRFLKEGPLGNINVPLTPGRSVALDHLLFPKGALAWLDTRRPRAEGDIVASWEPLTRFVFVQDTGGAIRGPGRLDLFFGHGPAAETEAGHMKEPGRLYLLVLKPEAVQKPAAR